METRADNVESEIQKFYEGKTIFITGASGFLGRLLVEKLLRSCKGLRRIYILLREKKGKNPEDRFKDVFDVPAFEPLKADQPDFLSKVSILEGDIMQPNVGLSEDHLTLIKEEVNCIFHVAASVRFDEKLRKAAYLNVRSVRDLLRLGKQMKHLESFLYISTAFSNCVRRSIDEVFYEPVITGDKMLELVECLDEDLLDKITPIILQDVPNTYVLTKSIAEEVVKSESKGLPVAIFRPSIVISTYREPIEGWVDNIYGPTSILQGSAIGLLRSIHGRKTNCADLVPADFVINCMIAAAWDVARNHNEDSLVKNGLIEKETTVPKIFNYVSQPQNPITWDRYHCLAWEEGMKIPSPMIIWYPTFASHSNYFAFWITSFLTQTVPAYTVDFFLRLIGKKPMFVQVFKKIDKFCDALSYFTMNQWEFKNNNTQNLYRNMNAVDKKLYNFDMSSMPWTDFFKTYMLGGRVYLLKDPLDTLPQGKRKLLAIKIGHYTLITVLCLFLYSFLKVLFNLLF